MILTKPFRPYALRLLGTSLLGLVRRTTRHHHEHSVPSVCQSSIATSPEKFTLLTGLAETFNATGQEFDGECAAITVYRVSSGAAARMLSEGWPTDGSAGPAPVLWSPSASTWGAIVNQRLTDQGLTPIANDFQRIMLTPLVLGMPRPMAEAMGWPEADIGWADILALASDPEGWGSLDHPEWGDFRLGKTNPNFSTSGLSATAAIYYAATGKTSGLTEADLTDPEVVEFVRGVEAATVHYGDTTLTFLDNMYRADQAGRGLTYVSAVAVEEVSIIAYNRGDPADTGTLDPSRVCRWWRVPERGTLYSDNPAFILDGDWSPMWLARLQRLSVHLSSTTPTTSDGYSSSGSDRETQRWQSATRSTPPTASTRASPTRNSPLRRQKSFRL